MRKVASPRRTRARVWVVVLLIVLAVGAAIVLTAWAMQSQSRVMVVSRPAAPQGEVVGGQEPPAAVATEGEVVAGEEPPAPVAEVIVPAPGPEVDFLWVPGWWMWTGGRWHWQVGHWEHRPHPGAEWVPHAWVHGPHGWVLHRGRWR